MKQWENGNHHDVTSDKYNVKNVPYRDCSVMATR
jgi:hypothetical protein